MLFRATSTHFMTFKLLFSDICPEGEYRNDNNECKKCEHGKFQNVTGQQSCKSCGAGQTTLEMGSTSEDKCVRKLRSPCHLKFIFLHVYLSHNHYVISYNSLTNFQPLLERFGQKLEISNKTVMHIITVGFVYDMGSIWSHWLSISSVFMQWH